MDKKKEKRRLDLPHNTEAEKAVLGAMIRSNSIFMDFIYKLDIEDFYPENENHRVIFAAMQRLNKEGLPVDSQTITNELINANQLEVSGAPEYLIDLADDPDVIDVLKYLRQREVVHFQRFGEALRTVEEKLAEKKFYMNNMGTMNNNNTSCTTGILGMMRNNDTNDNDCGCKN